MKITHLAHLKIHQHVLSSIKLLKTHQFPTKLNLNLDLIPIYIIHIKSLIHAILPHITQINLLPRTPKIPSNLPLWIYHLLLLQKKLYSSQKTWQGIFIPEIFSFSPCTRGRHIQCTWNEARYFLIYGRSYSNNNNKDSQHIRPNFISIFIIRLYFTSIIRASKQSFF